MPAISKYSSMVYRLGQIYFDEQLEPYHIGSGQQFFLLHIHRQPGINQFELGHLDHYDKGTTARAVKKLEEQGYIVRKTDENDHRIIKLFITKKGEDVVMLISEILKNWHEILCQGIDEDEREQAATLMGKIARNAKSYIKER